MLNHIQKHFFVFPLALGDPVVVGGAGVKSVIIRLIYVCCFILGAVLHIYSMHGVYLYNLTFSCFHTQSSVYGL